MSERERGAVKSRPEVLAPAGDWDALRAAVSHGADAVYFGIPGFNARYRAKNFETNELPEVFAYLRKHNVRGYVAFNTLVFSDELPEAVAALAGAAKAGADAFIVQDLGVARLLKTAAPAVAVHGSTQMTLTEPRGIEFVQRLGVERVILAHELSLDEVKAVAERTAVELEVFVHGALCVAYSGQCLTSEALGGRSANRGQCAQACRMPYALVVDGRVRDLGDKSYLLSPQDLSAHSLVGDLLAAGVKSLKIEGRLKGAPYVSATTQTYRAAVDAALQGEQYTPSRQESRDLEQSFSRGLSLGFLGGLNHQTLVPARFPKSRGVRVGDVTGVTKRGVVVRLDERHPDAAFLQPGDGVVFDLARPES
ncbi:MAG TPA: peptidase U32 family protein, partial [Pirellulales bacterium]